MLLRVFIEEVLRLQSGVISRRQALDSGLSDDQIDWRLATGRWWSVHPRVYRLADREIAAESRLHAAGLWAGPGATVSGLAAAWWHRLLDEPPSIVEVTVAARRGLRSGRGVLVRRRDLAQADR